MGTVLVIGAAGLVGAHVSWAFDSERVVRTYHREKVEGGLPLDVTDGRGVRRLVDEACPDTIVLAAAEAWVDRCEREPDATRRINVDAARDVAGAAREVSARLVVFSSEYVFDGKAGPYLEDYPVAPINEYGRQKVALEAIARTVPRHLVCRTSGVFGWELARKNFVCQLIDSLRARQAFRVPNDQLITPTYAPDLARAVVGLIRADAQGTFHVVGPRIVRRTDFARTAAQTFGLPTDLIEELPTEAMGYAASRPLSCGLRDDIIREIFGRPLRTPDAALTEMRASEPTT